MKALYSMVRFGLVALAIGACGKTGDKGDNTDGAISATDKYRQPTSSFDAGDSGEESGVTGDTCGNGIVEPPEQCDDQNQDDADGCNFLCEFTCLKDVDCDDGNICNGVESCTDQHTCASGSRLKDGQECGLSRSCRGGRCMENICGDRLTQPGEECDDGDDDPDDGCTAQCRLSCVADDPSRGCANECDTEAACDAASHTCKSASPLPDNSPCDNGKGYCLKGKCTPNCSSGETSPSGECPGGNQNGLDAGPGTDGGGICGQDRTPGTYARTVQDRTFLLHIPAFLDASKPAVLVFVHHGFVMSGEIMLNLTSWAQIADEEGIVVAFPDGPSLSPWNVGEGAVCGSGELLNNHGQDDFGFVENMIEDIDRKVCIDRSKVFTTGFSMGGYFSNNIACRDPGLVRAVAPHSGGAEIDYECPFPKPVMIIHGTADPLIAYQCGLDARDKWVKINGCSAEVDSVQVKGGVCERNRNCPAGARVEMCSFNGMGHGWAGTDDPTYGMYGAGSQYEDGARLAWRFFKEQLAN